MKNQTRIYSGKPAPKNPSPETQETRKTELDYMCTYMTWLTIKERYTKEMSLMAG
jgi:hypothetical protein